MTLPEFDYAAPKTLHEASALLAGNPGAELMAGGTDLILQIPKLVPKGLELVIDLKTVPGLDEIRYSEDEGLYIGANAKLFDIHNNEAIKENLPAVADAAHYVGSSQIRRKGTMVGSICNASPTGDCGAILLAMNARAHVYSNEGERDIPMDEFWLGLKKIAADKAKGEIVTGITVPALKSGEGSAYIKHSVRKAMDLAIVGVAAWIKLDGNKVTDCRIAVAGGGVVICRAKAAEQLLIGEEINDAVLEKVGAQAAAEMHPRDSIRASAEYRTDMIRVFTKRAIRKALETVKA